MKREHVPIIALTLAVPLLGLLWVGGEPFSVVPGPGVDPGADPGSDSGSHSGAGPMLPWLTLLLISEFGLILTAVGLFLGIQYGHHQGWSGRHALITLGCALASLAFLLQLIRWWPL